MKIALFGGSGFVGKRVMHFLNEKNLIFTEISRSPVSRISYHANISQINSLLAINESFDCVIICSAKLPQREYLPEDLNSFTEVNIMGINNILSWASKRGVSKIIYCSTLSFLPLSEEHDETELLDTSSHYIYKISKAAAEHFVIGFCKHHHIDYCSLRIASVYGPGMKEDILYHFISKIKKGQNIVLQNSNLTADFIHVDDVATAIVACLKESIKNQIINVTSGSPIFLKDLAQLISEIMNLPSPYLEIKSVQPIAKKGHSDKKIKKILSQRIDLETGIKQLVNFL